MDTASIDSFVQAIAIILIVVVLLIAQLAQCAEGVQKYYILLMASKNYLVVWLITWQVRTTIVFTCLNQKYESMNFIFKYLGISSEV